MKKIILILCSILLFCFIGLSQVIVNGIDINKLENVKYIEIVGIEKMFKNKLTIMLDYGQFTKILAAAKKLVILDKNNKMVEFNSMVEALNFLCKNGWEYVHSYAINYGDSGIRYHTLLKRKE